MYFLFNFFGPTSYLTISLKNWNTRILEVWSDIEDIKCLSRASSIAFSFNHVSRKCNQVAHVLAKSAGLLCDSVWFNVPP
jgi:hypothetical protein